MLSYLSVPLNSVRRELVPLTENDAYQSEASAPLMSRHAHFVIAWATVEGTVKPPIVNTPMAEHTADTKQFPWSQHAPLTYRRSQLRNNFLLGTKNLIPDRSLFGVFTVVLFRISVNNSPSIR